MALVLLITSLVANAGATGIWRPRSAQRENKKNKKAKQLRKEKRVFDTASVSSDSLKIKLS